MTDINVWINAQMSTLKDNVSILEENRENMDKFIIQMWCIKRHIDSTLDFLERSKKFG